ncbi:MAG: hypothetical protein HQL22_03415 [Candidatus Omnitrophica bacterium]|nr:hypothetical protein [Candidatus Omnitrophota bacterium]
MLGIIALGGCASDREAARIFGNMTYYVGNQHFAEPATLINCEYGAPFLHLYYDNKFVYGDFNHDGLKDAAVITVENTGGNADWYMLNFLINDGKKFVHRASRALDDRAIIHSMWQKDNKVFIDMYVHQEGDCTAGPTKHVKNVYEYTGPDIFGLEKNLWKAEEHYNPQRGFVPDETTAIKIADAVLTATYGAKEISKEKPLDAYLANDIWTVSSVEHGPDEHCSYNKSVFSIGIRQDNGSILSVSREK